MIAEAALHALNGEFRDVQPYPGLRPFKYDEARYFKGRDAQVEEIIQRLASDHCVVVLGGSGCGKSSIVRAGVIPALRLKMVPDRGDFWRVAICSPGRAPVANLVAALDGLLVRDDSGERRKQIQDVLYGSDGLGGFLPVFKRDIPLGPDLSEAIPDKANLLILIDQFEELFREENRGTPEAAALAGFLTDAWRRRDGYPDLYLVLTMRTDDLHRCAEFLDLPDVINAASYLTRRLKETELRQAIVAPVRPAMFRAKLLQEGWPAGMADLRPYDVQVVTELLDTVEEIAHDPDHLPLLQHLLALLWRTTLERWHREAAACPGAAESRVTLQDLARALGFEHWDEVVRAQSAAYHQGIGGWLLRHCLDHAAEELYAGSMYDKRLTEQQQEIARVTFCLVGEVDDRGNFKRRWTNQEEIARVAGFEKPNDNVEAVIRRFSEDHYLFWVRESGVIDISHESLMRNWPRLGKQLEEDRDAGAAYRYLVDRYREWQQAQPHQFYLSWLTKWVGLLPAREVERVKRFYEGWKQAQPRQFWPSWLMKWIEFFPLHMFGRVKRLAASRYNRYWAERFISDGGQHRDAEVTGPQRRQELLDHGLVFLACRQYLRHSVVRNFVARWMKPILVIAFVMLASYGYIRSQQTQRAEMQARTAERQARRAERQVDAAFMWGTFTPSSPSSFMDDKQVESLWILATKEIEFRSIFVGQLAILPQSTSFGFRPQPMMRAVGLRWPKEVRNVGLRATLEQAGKPKDGWHLAALACAVEALGERIDAGDKKQALDLLNKYVRAITPQAATDRWLLSRLTRVFACTGNQLETETREQALGEMKKAVENTTRHKDSSEISAIANAAAVIAFLPDTPLLREDTLSATMKSVFDGLGRETRTFRAMQLARPLAPLMAKLPNQEQKKEFLLQLLSAVSTKTELNTDENLLLVLAQAVEVLAEQNVFSGENQLEQWFSDVDGKKWLTLAEPDDGTVGPLAVAWLITPLVKGDEMPTTVVNKLLGTAQVKGSATDLSAATQALLQALKETKETPMTVAADRLRLGLRGRLLATLITYLYKDKADLATTVKEVSGIAALASKLDQPSRHVALEGMARLLAALAPGLEGKSREEALQTARKQLAGTGSADEAAAWSRAIVKLLEGTKSSDEEFVKQIVEILKYPNTALIAREPGVSEPQSATDILVEALRDRLELPAEERRWNRGMQQVLNAIEKDTRFSRISLTTPPPNPNKKEGGSRRVPSPGPD